MTHVPLSPLQDALERETRVLREMRDVAVLEQDRLRAQLRDLNAEHNDVTEQLRDLRRLHDVRVTELQAQLSLKSLDAEHARAALDDKTNQVGRGGVLTLSTLDSPYLHLAH